MGGDKPDFIMIVEFPNQESLQKLFGGTEYAKLSPYREKAFKKLNVFISKKEYDQMKTQKRVVEGERDRREKDKNKATQKKK